MCVCVSVLKTDNERGRTGLLREETVVNGPRGIGVNIETKETMYSLKV